MRIHDVLLDKAVFRVSKLKSLKAIHNQNGHLYDFLEAVFRVSKLKSLKAIHNEMRRTQL